MKRNFVPVFLFLRFAENMSRYWDAFSGFTKFRRPGAAHRTKAGQKNCRQKPPPKPAACKKQLPKRTAGNGFALFLIYPYMFLIKG